MLVGDGFSVLDTNSGTLDEQQKVREVQVTRVAIEKIIPNPYQPCKVFEDDALTDLAASVAQYGVLQPLLVAPSENGQYLLIAGERRLRAAQLAKLPRVPVIIREYSAQEIAEIALIENLQREDLNYLEEAEGYEQLVEQFHMTQEAIAERVGKKQSTIANKLRLLRLSANVRKILNDNGLSERHARALLLLENEARQLDVLNVVIQQGYSVRQTEDYIANLLDVKPAIKRKRLIIVNDVRIYLNSIKKIATNIKDAGIPCEIEQAIEDDEVAVTIRIKNMKKPNK